VVCYDGLFRERRYASETGEKKYLLPVATVLSYFPVREFVSSKLPQAADRTTERKNDGQINLVMLYCTFVENKIDGNKKPFSARTGVGLGNRLGGEIRKNVPHLPTEANVLPGFELFQKSTFVLCQVGSPPNPQTLSLHWRSPLAAP
jgi:hypothetical protein